MTTEEFIQKARSIHGNKYDYSKVEYINSKTKVCIICPEHGEFWQDSSHHFRGHGCPKCCLTGIKLTSKNFVEKARFIHGNKYDYSKVEYINAQTKIRIICPEHGEFFQKPYSHLNNHGCPKCKGYLANHIKAKELFIETAQKIHGMKYDYSKVNYINNKAKVCIICPEHGEFWQTPSLHLRGAECPECFKNSRFKLFVEKSIKTHNNKYDYSKVNYISAETKVCIICPEHGEFWQTPHQHLRGYGCQKCNFPTTKDFIKKSIKIHGNKYNYSKSKYVNSRTKICIICPEHGEFWQIPHTHLGGAGCPLCNESHGEREIRKLLDKYDIKYEREKTFPKLNGIRGFPLRFDFYLPDDNICIEFDGIQHRKFIPMMYRSEKQFEMLKEHDRRKDEFCKKNGIHLIRIWKDEENQFHKDKIC